MLSRSLLMLTIVCGPMGTALRAQGTRPAEQERAPVSRNALSTTEPGEYDNLVLALADPELQVRDVATERLCLLDVSYLPQLAKSFRQESDFEIKRRLRYVVEYIFHREQIVGQNGFLGVEIDRDALRVGYDPTTKSDVLGIGVRRVMDGFAARRGGMEDGDIIIKFNGEAIPDDSRSSSAFVEQVSSHAPGEPLDLTVLRTKDARSIVSRTGEEPKKLLDGAVLEPCVLTPGVVGAQVRRALRVVHVEEGSPASTIGLPLQSCILEVNDRPLDAATPDQVLRTLLNDAEPNTELNFKVAEAREVQLQVVLGTRPVSMIQATQGQEARDRFMAFWKEQGGEFLSLRHRNMYSINREYLRTSGQLMPEVRVLP